LHRFPGTGTAAAAAGSDPNVSTTNNFIISASFRSVEWWGDLVMQQLNPDGTLSPLWSAMQQLDCTTTAWQADARPSTSTGLQLRWRLLQHHHQLHHGASFNLNSIDTTNAA
jgi:type IV pilus assembly protein PilY1